MRNQSKRKLQVLYVVYWGAAEPLGQSLVLPAVKKLAEMGAGITLVTFEKPADLVREEEMERIRRGLEEKGVRWIPLKYHKHPKVPATAFDVFQGLARSVIERLRVRPDVVHARTFIGGLMGMMIASALRVKWVYHNEGFYPDEEVDGGVWQAGSAPHRVAKFLERQMYGRADGIIVLSQRAKEIVEGFPDVESQSTQVAVVPSCVNLEHFRRHHSEPPSPECPLRFVYSGNVGKRYLLDQVGRFVSVALERLGSVHFCVLTRAEPSLVTSMLNASRLPKEAWSMTSVPYSEMPGALAEHHVGLHFLRRGLSEHGGSPTKIGEYWAAGLPVVVTPNAGDTDEIIRRERVGVVVNEHSEAEYVRALDELRAILAEPDLPQRCRRTAEAYYALEPACERQYSLYRQLSERPARLASPNRASEFTEP